MPFVENPSPPPTGLARWLSVAAAALSTALYDGSDAPIFAHEETVDELTDTLPPFAGADEGVLTVEASSLLGDGEGRLAFEFRGGASSSSSPSPPLSTLWSAVAEASNLSLAIRGDGSSEGSATYSSQPWRYFTNGTSLVQLAASTSGEVAAAAKCGPISVKALVAADPLLLFGDGGGGGPSSQQSSLVSVESCAASVRLALPEDILCGHVLPPRLVDGCGRALHLGLAWEAGIGEGNGGGDGDTLRGTAVFSTMGYSSASASAWLAAASEGGSSGSGNSGGWAASAHSMLATAKRVGASLLSPSGDYLHYGVWGTVLLHRGRGGRSGRYSSSSPAAIADHRRGSAVSVSSFSTADGVASFAGSAGSDEGDSALATGGFKLLFPRSDTELCVAAEYCSSGAVDTSFGVRRSFPAEWSQGTWWGGFPFALSAGRTTDGDWGAAVALEVVDAAIVLGAHRRSDADGGFFGGMPTFGMSVAF